MRRVFVALLFLPTLVVARNIPARPPSGILQTCAATCVTGVGPTGLTGDPDVKFVASNGSVAVVFQAALSGTATVTVENSIDDGANWTTVAGTSMSAAGINKTAVVNPVGWYRTNVTVCTACTFTTRFYEERAVGQSW